MGRKLPPGEASANHLYRLYSDRAKRKGVRWHLSKKEFKALTRQSCFYCGVPPYKVHQLSHYNGGHTYNGLDRINPRQGYVRANVVPCCQPCNMAKGAMTLNGFYGWLCRLVAHQIKRGNFRLWPQSTEHIREVVK